MDQTKIIAQGIGFKAGGKKILNGISVGLFPGEVTAILGPSGSGKSTFLKCITTENTPSDGILTVNGTPLKNLGSEFRQNLGYVPQDDIIHRELSVHQAFYYAARLRLNPALSEEAIEAKINLATQQLGLEHRKFLRIKKLSGGQRKRVNIGIELLSDPQLFLLDEPASGLDPATEEDLLKVLRSLAESGKTILLTTHSMEYLNLVDRILILAAGMLIFAGSRQELLEHFQIAHPADMFKTIREKSESHWQNQFSISPLSRRAMEPMIKNDGTK